MRCRAFVVSFFTMLLSVSTGFADVTLKSQWRSSGFQGMGASEGAMTRSVQGSKAREDSEFKFSGKMMKFMTGGEKSGTQILRVDLDKIWRLNLKKKSYTETSISAQAEKIKSAPRKEEPKAEPEAGTPAEEKPTHRVKKTEVTVKKTGAKKTINGFSTEETEGRMKVDVEEIASGEVTSYLMLTHFWLTPWTADLKKASDEEVAFQKAYLAKMGFTFSPKDREMFGGPALGMMLGVGEQKTADLIKQLKEKTKDLNGFPIVTDSEWSMVEDPKAIQRKKDAQAKAAAEEDSNPELSADPQEMAGNLLGAFAKKKMTQRKATKDKEQEGKPAFSAYHEVLSLTVASAEASLFKIPAGFKKVE